MRADFIPRAPLRYGPSSITDYRRERLPDPESYASMVLADTRAFTPAPPDVAAWIRTGRFFFVVSAATVVLAHFGRAVPQPYVLAAAAVLACVLAVHTLFREEPSPVQDFLWRVLPVPALLASSALLAPLLGHRLAASALLAALAAAALFYATRRFSSFWHDWLHCTHRLSRPVGQAGRPAVLQPDWLYVFAFFSLVVVLSPFSSWAAACAGLAWTLARLGWGVRQAVRVDPKFSLRRLAAYALQRATLPRSYAAAFRPYPGCWNPREHRRIASGAFTAALLLVSVQLAVALSAYFPWDVPPWRNAFLRTFRTGIHTRPWHMAVVRRTAPATDWSRFPEPYRPPDGALSAPELAKKLPSLSPEARFKLLAQYKEQRVQAAARGRKVDRAFADALNRSPFLWMHVALWGLVRGETLFAYPWLCVCLGSILVPPLFLFTAFFRPLLRMQRIERRRERRSFTVPHRPQRRSSAASETRVPALPPTPWERYNQILRTSGHEAADPLDPSAKVQEARHFFMGHEPHLGFPVLLDRRILSHHAYILGGTGFGKTSLGVIPLVMRLIRGQLEPGETPSRGTAESRMPPMLIIDLKGDMALFQTVKHEVADKAKAEGRSLQDAFRVFSCERGHACHAFNPLANLGMQTRASVELCNVFLDALNLNHGEGYGRSYYTMRSRSLLQEVLKQETPPPDSFEALYAALLRRRRREAFREAFELVATVEALTDYDRICKPVTDPNEPVIHMPDVVRNRQVVYFWLPAAEHSLTAKEIASLALYTFYTALREWTKSDECRARKLRPEGFLVVDEFQRVASRNFPNILREARSFGLGVLLAHQSARDLELPDMDLSAIVRENTRLKLFFAIQDPGERELFSKMSGQELALQPSMSVTSSDTTESVTPILKPRITPNDIIETSDHPFDYFMLVGQGAGYTQFGGYPFAVRTSWPLPTEVYRARSEAAWPDKADLGLSDTAPANAASPAEIDAHRLAAVSRVDELTQRFLEDDPTVLL